MEDGSLTLDQSRYGDLNLACFGYKVTPKAHTRDCFRTAHIVGFFEILKTW